jgi:hypothetical protein
MQKKKNFPETLLYKKKITRQENSSLFWIAFLRTERESRKPYKNLGLGRLKLMPIILD